MRKLIDKIKKRAGFTEPVDSKPMAIPVGFQRPPTLQEQVARLVRTEVSRRAAEQGLETFEEADDFEVGDDFEPNSPHELVFDPELGREMSKAEKQYIDEGRAAFDAAAKNAPRKKKYAEEEEPIRKKKKSEAKASDEDDQE